MSALTEMILFSFFEMRVIQRYLESETPPTGSEALLGERRDLKKDYEVAPDRLDETLVKTAVKSVPTVVMAETATTEIKAAIKPYSMAVAPFSSRTN